MFNIIDDQQNLFVPQKLDDLLFHRLGWRLKQAADFFADSGRNLVHSGEWCERNKKGPVNEKILILTSNFERQTRFSDPSRPN